MMMCWLTCNSPRKQCVCVFIICCSWCLNQGAPERQSLQLRCTLGAIRPVPMERRNACRASDAIRSGSRYAKWAGGSRSQTHRRAAKGGFTQDDGYVQGVAPMHYARPPLILLERRVSATIILSSIPIPVPGQYRVVAQDLRDRLLSRCLE
jgi:hypothetical protein